MARQGDCLRGIVNNQVNTGERLKGADIAPFTPDDPALHLVARQRNDRNRDLRHIIRRAPADRSRNDLPGALVGLILELRLKL